MWIIKNETADTIALPELKVEIPCKEYLDLDAHGREKAETAGSVRDALARGALRSVSKTAPEVKEAAGPKARSSNPGGVLRDLAQNPPLPGLVPLSGPPPKEAAIGVREAFRKITQRKSRRADREEPPATPEIAAMRQELERFRRNLLEDMQRLLDDYLRS